MDKNLEYEPVRGAHILMIVNPVSGRISGEHTADKLEAWLKENGAAVDRFETTETENGSGYTAKLAENDYARVVVLGGDGTLNAVLNGMLHRALRTPITYLPSGTTNDFAQTLGIQKHLLDPYKSFTETEDRLIDAVRLIYKVLLRYAAHHEAPFGPLRVCLRGHEGPPRARRHAPHRHGRRQIFRGRIHFRRVQQLAFHRRHAEIR